MHAGAPPPALPQQTNGTHQQYQQPMNRESIGDSVDDLIKSVTGEGGPPQATPSARPAPRDLEPVHVTPAAQEPSHSTPALATPTADNKDKKSKKAKDDKTVTKLIYSDNETSPEEKRAGTSRYTFDRSAHEHTELIPDEFSGGASGDAVTGVLDDTVRDPQDTHPA